MEDLAYEAKIKQYILDNPHLFVSPDKTESTVYFEKSIYFGNTIADCLVFNSYNYEIGIEIKTGHDSTYRLRKQLRDYIKVCDYVWVVIHESLTEEVLGILDELHLPFVGVITYIEYDGDVAGGIYRQASYNPVNSSYMAMMMMWSKELKVMAKAVAERNNENINKMTKKSQYIKYIIKKLGNEDAKGLLCNFIISGQGDPNKVTNSYRFNLSR